MTAKDDSTDADVDPLYGDAKPSADSIPEDVPDHEVELHIADPLPEEQGPLFHFEPSGRSIEGGDAVQFTTRCMRYQTLVQEVCFPSPFSNSGRQSRGTVGMSPPIPENVSITITSISNQW